MRKRIWAALLAVLMLSVCFSQGTLAYFTDTECIIKSHTFEIEQPPAQPDILDIALRVDSTEDVIIAGMGMNTSPTISNEGDADAYVRMNLYVPKAMVDSGLLMWDALPGRWEWADGTAFADSAATLTPSGKTEEVGLKYDRDETGSPINFGSGSQYTFRFDCYVYTIYYNSALPAENAAAAIAKGVTTSPKNGYAVDYRATQQDFAGWADAGALLDGTYRIEDDGDYIMTNGYFVFAYEAQGVRSAGYASVQEAFSAVEAAGGEIVSAGGGSGT